MSEDIKEIKVTKKPGFAIKFDGTYKCVYSIIDKYVSIFGKYSARFSLDHAFQPSRHLDDGPKKELELTIILNNDDASGNPKLELTIGKWIVFFGADVRIYTDNDFKATFDSEDRND